MKTMKKGRRNNEEQEENIPQLHAITNRRPIPKEEFFRLRKEGKCFRCKQPGHFSRECPNIRRFSKILDVTGDDNPTLQNIKPRAVHRRTNRLTGEQEQTFVLYLPLLPTRYSQLQRILTHQTSPN